MLGHGLLGAAMLGLGLGAGMLGLEDIEAAVDIYAVDCGSSDKPFHFQQYSGHFHQ